MRFRLFGAGLFCLAVAACGGGNSPGGFIGVPTASPSAAPTAMSTHMPLGNGSALVQQPVATAVPAPAGYSANISAPFVTTGANTSIAVTAGVQPPVSLPVIASAKRPSALHREVSGAYNAVYYDVLVPSQSITASGTISITQQFPAGALNASTSYYLGFYDGTQASPTWQTISGPVQDSNNSLTFSGNIGSFTLQANGTYGFCIFALASTSATPPPSQSQDVAYLSQFTNGIRVVNASGATVNTIGINSSALALDDSGNIYNLYLPTAPSPSPGASSTPTPPPAVMQSYAAGSTTPSSTYNVNSAASFIEGSGSGQVAAIAFDYSSGMLTVQVWNPQVTGNPSYTISSQQYSTPSFDVQHDGTIYLGGLSASGTYQYSVYPPGSSTPSRTISESIVPTAQQTNFSPNYMTVGPDGTLYVTEYTFNKGDSLAGLYIYPPNGQEKFVATASDSSGAGPQGVDVDAAGNIYVANNNAGWIPTSYNPVASTVQNVQVFAPGGASVLRTIDTGSYTPFPVVVAPDGTLFFSAFPMNPSLTGVPQGTFVVAPGSTTPTQASPQGETSIVLYNGYEESAALRHRMSTASFGVSASHAGAAAFRSYQQAIHRIR